MDEIKKECYKGNLNTLLMAYTQTAGRGRNNNTWVSNLGNLFLSIKLNTLKMSNPLILNYITGIVVYDTLKFFLEKKILASEPTKPQDPVIKAIFIKKIS